METPSLFGFNNNNASTNGKTVTEDQKNNNNANTKENPSLFDKLNDNKPKENPLSSSLFTLSSFISCNMT